MKKKLLFLVMFTLIGVNYYSQPGTSLDGSSSGGGSCVSQLFTNLNNCLVSNGVSFTMFNAGDEMYLYGAGNPPPGQIQSCLAQYDNDRVGCAAAPVIIDKTGLNQRKMSAR